MKIILSTVFLNILTFLLLIYLKYNITLIQNEINDMLTTLNHLKIINEFFSSKIFLFDNYKVLKPTNHKTFITNNNLLIKNLLINNSAMPNIHV